jgi:multidrug efflux pump
MNISKFAVNNRVTVYILVIIIILMGITSYVSIPKEAAPSITIPNIFVSTLYYGVSPQDIENLVTQEIEKEVKGIKDVKNITSISQESFSLVNIEFNPDVKIDDALQKVRDKVSIAKSKMPRDIEEPVINEFNLSEQPMLYINLSGNFGLARLKEVGDHLSDKIESIPGVLNADVIGGLEREVKINVDANKLKYYNLSFDDLIKMVSAENQSIPGGKVDIGESDYLVRIPGEFTNPEGIKDLIVKAEFEQPIYVRDVADVIYGFKDRTSFSSENGNESVTLVIKKRSGENIIRIAGEIKDLVEDERSTLPEGIRISFTGDMSEHIENTVHELENGIITGMLLVCMVLLASMGLKNAFLVATSIPLSFLISFSVLSMMGITLNIVVLFSLILVLGIIVDDAVVVTENIYRLQEQHGLSPYKSAIEGPHEVQTPVIIATFTIISSFAPLLFFPGIVGEFMKYLPITLIVCLFASLFVALIINPVLAVQFINYKKEHAQGDNIAKWKIITRFHYWFNTKFNKLINAYEKTLRFCTSHRKLTISGTVGLLFLIMILFSFLNRGVEFFPETEPKQAFIYVTMPIGTSIYKTKEVTEIVEEKLPKYKDIEYYVTNVGSEIGGGLSGGDKSNISTITVNFYNKEDREENTFTTLDKIRNDVTGITTADVRIKAQAGGPPTGPPVNIEISGDDFQLLGGISDTVKRLIQNIDGLVDLKDDFERGMPEIKVNIDREKAALYQINTSVIAHDVRTAINGTVASKYRVADEEYDITVRLDSSQRDNVETISNLFIPGKDGAKIPLTSVASIDFAGGIGAINRKDLKRVVTVSAETSGRLPNEILIDVKEKLSGLKLPPGYAIVYTGEQQDQQESQDFLGKAFMISLLFVFFFLVLEFNKISTPIIIMFTVLLSLIGVLIGLLVTGTPFGIVMTGIGVIALGGIVVRNAIVLLDFQKELEKRGMSRNESVIQSGIIRLRPVVLTAVTTILGLVPLTTGVDFDWRSFSWVIGGENTAFWRPMGVAIIFGLSFATFLTLVVVPSIFISWNEIKEKYFNKEAEPEGEDTDTVAIETRF